MSPAKKNQNKALDFWAKARESYLNLQCLKANCQNLDWQTTTCFYTALQMMKAYILVHHKLETSHHDEIKQYLPKKPHIQTAYGRLKELSTLARYSASSYADIQGISDTLHYAEAEAKLKLLHKELCAKLPGFAPFIS